MVDNRIKYENIGSDDCILRYFVCQRTTKGKPWCLFYQSFTTEPKRKLIQPLIQKSLNILVLVLEYVIKLGGLNQLFVNSVDI